MAPFFENLVEGSTPTQADYTIVSPSPSHLLPGFHQVCCFTRNTLSIFFALIRLLQKIMHFQSKTNFLIKLILLVGFDFAVLCICVS